MKKVILTLVAMLAMSAATCMAQDDQQRPEGKGPRGGNMVEQMKTELKLSDDQATKLEEVFKSMRPGKPGEGSSKSERPSKEDMDKQRTEMETKVKEILTEEQYTQFQKMQSQRRPPRGGKRPEKKSENSED